MKFKPFQGMHALIFKFKTLIIIVYKNESNFAIKINYDGIISIK